MSNAPLQSNHISALDGLRALAIILVLFRHGVIFYLRHIGYEDNSDMSAIWHVFVNGWVGVDLFFVLSGFLISRAFFLGHRPPIKLYLWKRALRIFPAYYAVLLLCVAGAFPFYGIAQENLGFRILYHVFFLQDYLPSDINIVFWSLGVEEKFYLAAPFVLAGILKLHQRNTKLAISAFVGLICFGIGLRGYSFWLAGEPEAYSLFFMAARSPFHACLEPLVIGMMIAFSEMLYRKRCRSEMEINPKSASYIFYGSLTFFFLFLLSHEFMASIGWYDATAQPLLIALATGGMVWGAVFGGAPPVFSIRPLRFIAKISYSIYLIHLPLWPLSFFVLSHLTAGNAPDLADVPLFLLVYFIISVLAAFSLYTLIERPFLKLKERFSIARTPS